MSQMLETGSYQGRAGLRSIVAEPGAVDVALKDAAEPHRGPTVAVSAAFSPLETARPIPLSDC